MDTFAVKAGTLDPLDSTPTIQHKRKLAPTPTLDTAHKRVRFAHEPKLTASLNQEYFNRSVLPTHYDLIRDTKFGKPNTNQSFSSGKSFHHVILPLFQSGFLHQSSMDCIMASYPRASLLWTEYQRLQHVDFRPLRHPNPNWSSQAAIDPHRVDMMAACLLHYNLDVPSLVRYCGGEYLGTHLQPQNVLPAVEDILDPSVVADLRRILTYGVPGHVNGDITAHQFREYLDYCNHSSLAENLEHTRKVINKEDRNSSILTLPRWMAPFIPDCGVAPQGLILKPDRKPRLVYDGSYQHSPTSIPYNWFINLANEPEIVFGQALPGYITELCNLRISYPNEDIDQKTDDVTRAFRRGKYNPQVVPAKGFLFENHLHFAVGQTFGDKSSPSNFEPFARARCALAQHYWRINAQVPEYPDYLDHVKYDAPPDASTVFTQVRPDKYLHGVHRSDGSRLPTHYFMFVDDAMYADIRPRMNMAMRYSVHSANVTMGLPEPALRTNTIDYDKFLQQPVSHAIEVLGNWIDTRAMAMGLTPSRRTKIIKLLATTWHDKRRSFTLLQGAQLLGTLIHACQVCHWGQFLFISLYRHINDLLHRNHLRLLNTPAFHEILQTRPQVFDNRQAAARFNFFNSQVARDIWRSHTVTYIDKSLRDELRFLRQVLTNPSVYTWSSPLVYLIPREPDYSIFGDACLTGAGGFSVALNFYWVEPWPMAIQRRTLRYLRRGDKSLIPINWLEYLAVIVNLAAAIVAWESLPSTQRPHHPILLILTDNKTAEAWTRRVSGMKASAARTLGKIFAHILMFSDVGCNAAYLQGEKNDVADYISRIYEKKHSHPVSFADIVQKYPQLKCCHHFQLSAELRSLLFSALQTGSVVIPTTRVPLGQLLRDRIITSNSATR